MATRNYSSVSPVASLSAAISDTDTTITVSSTGPWPAAPFTLILDYDDPDEEVVEVTSKNGTNNFFTITRGVDGTAAKSHPLGAVVVHGVSARDFAEVNTFINTVPTISLQPSAPSSPSDGDIWIDSDSSADTLNPADYVLKSELPEPISAFLLMGA